MVAAEVGGLALTADVTNRDELRSVLAAAEGGLGAVTGLVDIVGFARIGPLSELDDDAFGSQFDVVLRHAYLALQIVGEAIARSGGGSMVFVGSLAGSDHVAGQAAYGAAKAALHHLVGSMGRELAPARVRVNAVAPGFVHTPRLDARLQEDAWRQVERLIPVGAAAQPSEIAAAILFLASDLASHVTGQVLMADGGLGRSLRLPDVWS
jgi:NAD(P)-dependent dehydrogenase (short-subunit alcohol dehydrogenase family)